MGNVTVGLLFLHEQRGKLVDRMAELQYDYQLQRVNDKWCSLLLNGASIEEDSIQRVVQALSHNLPIAYFTLEEACFEYQIYNCGEKIAAFKLEMSGTKWAETLEDQLAESNVAAWGLFGLTNEEVLRLIQLFTCENLAEEMGVNQAIAVFKSSLLLQGLSWHNGRCVAGNEMHRVVTVHNSPLVEEVTKSDLTNFGIPGFWKLLVLMWKEPRRVARYIVETDYMNWAVWISIICGGLQYFMKDFLDPDKQSVIISILWGMLGGIMGLIGLYIFASMVDWTGRWINGKASFDHVKAVIGWKALVDLVNSIISLVVQMILFGGQYLYSFPATPFNREALPPANYGLFIVSSLVLGIWGLVISCKFLGEVQGFSALRALANYVLAIVMIAIIVLIGLLAFGILFAIAR